MSNFKDCKINPYNPKGMTLIEVVIVIAIVGIMSAISIVSYVTVKRDAELETSAEEIVAVLREAQNYSLTGKEISSACSTYSVFFSAGSGTYTMRNGGPTCGLTQIYSLKNGVTVSSFQGVPRFTAPHASVTQPSRIVIVKNTGYYTICVNTSGLISKFRGIIPCP